MNRISNNIRKIEELGRKYEQFRMELPRKVAITLENFFKRNFEVGGFVDKPFKKWKPAQNPRIGRKLMNKTGRLKRAIKRMEVSRNRIVVGVGKEVPYASIHNDGGKIAITPKMRRYFWAMHIKTGEVYFRNMAMTKKTHLDIPQRQFIGDSAAVLQTVDRMISKELKKAIE